MTAKQTTKRLWYGDRLGNSFVAAVLRQTRDGKIEHTRQLVGGEIVLAIVNSKHFQDQAEIRTATKGRFKDVLFYPEDIAKNLERKYRPGKPLIVYLAICRYQ